MRQQHLRLPAASGAQLAQVEQSWQRISNEVPGTIREDKVELPDTSKVVSDQRRTSMPWKVSNRLPDECEASTAARCLQGVSEGEGVAGEEAGTHREGTSTGGMQPSFICNHESCGVLLHGQAYVHCACSGANALAIKSSEYPVCDLPSALLDDNGSELWLSQGTVLSTIKSAVHRLS